MGEPFKWTVIQCKLGDLIDWDHNPVELSEHDAQEIARSLEKFGLAVPLVANAPDKNGKRRMIDGHQRKTVSLMAGRWGVDSVVNVSVPDRKLTEKECDELSIRLRRNTGQFSMDDLANNFDMADLLDWGFEEDELIGVDYQHPKMAETEKTIRPLPMVRVLVSVPVDSALDAKEFLDALAEVEGVEVLYGATDLKGSEL